MLFTYHPNEEADAKDTIDDIKKRVPQAKVEAVAVEIQTEQACFELAEKIKKWSGNELHVLYVCMEHHFTTGADKSS